MKPYIPNNGVSEEAAILVERALNGDGPLAVRLLRLAHVENHLANIEKAAERAVEHDEWAAMQESDIPGVTNGERQFYVQVRKDKKQ